jgi:hypothetical protein
LGSRRGRPRVRVLRHTSPKETTSEIQGWFDKNSRVLLERALKIGLIDGIRRVWDVVLEGSILGGLDNRRLLWLRFDIYFILQGLFPVHWLFTLLGALRFAHNAPFGSLEAVPRPFSSFPRHESILFGEGIKGEINCTSRGPLGRLVECW